MKSFPVWQVIDIWLDIRRGLFSSEMLFRSIVEVAKYVADNTYFDLRNTSEAKMLEVIEYLCSNDLTMDQLQSYVGTQPLTVQAFLYERFVHVDQYLHGMQDHQEIRLGVGAKDFLYWGLVDVWKLRPTKGME